MRLFLLFLGLAGFFLGWNTPNHYPLWTAFHGELAAAAGACLLFLGVLWPTTSPHGVMTVEDAATGRGQGLRLPSAAQLWLVAALVPVLQYLCGGLVFRGDAVLGFLYGLGTALSVYTGYLWAAQAGRIRVLEVLFITLVFGGVAAASLALVQWLRIPSPGWWAMELIEHRPYGNFAQPNHFGLSMVISIVAASALYEMRTLRHRFSYALLLLVFGWGLVISQSRAAELALLCVTACWFATCHRVPTRFRVWEVLLALGLGLLYYKSAGYVEELLYLKAAEVRAPLEVGAREWIWLHFLAAIAQRPWTGYGFGQGVLALREVADHVHPSRNTIYAHNVVLDLVTWTGIPLGLAMSAALVGWMLRWLRREDDVELMRGRHWVFAIWLGLLVQSMLEFPYAHTYFLLPCAVLAGAVMSGPSLATSGKTGRRFIASMSVIALGVVGIILVVVTASEYLQMEDDFRSNRFERANFTNQPAHDPLTRPWLLDQLAALNASAHFQIRRGMPAEEVAQLGVVARRFHLLPTRMDYAKALALNGRMDEAEQEMRLIRGIYHPDIYRRIEQDWLDWLKAQGFQASRIMPQS